MDVVDAAWHLLNFFAPALVVGAVTASGAKLVWWRSLRSVRWQRLAVWSVAACALTLVAGLWLFGHDGRMATYGAMVTVCALAVWWAGFGLRGK